MVGQGGALTGACVLIVEDEFLIAVDVQRIVEDAGAATVLLANSLSEARGHMARPAPIDVCILDLKLGAEDGMALVEQLQARNIPFVIASGLGGKNVADIPLVPKPYRDESVIDALTAVWARAKKV